VLDLGNGSSGPLWTSIFSEADPIGCQPRLID